MTRLTLGDEFNHYGVGLVELALPAPAGISTSTFLGDGTPCDTRMVRFAPRAASSKDSTTCARMLRVRRRCGA